MSNSSWTSLWNLLGVSSVKNNLEANSYKPNSDKNFLRKQGIDNSVIDEVYQYFSTNHEPLYFKKFVSFFKKDIKTIVDWSERGNVSNAFRFLFLFFKNKSVAEIKVALRPLLVLFAFYLKGEGQHFKSNTIVEADIKKLDIKNLTRRLNLSDKKSSYKFKGDAKLIDEYIYEITKRSGNRNTSKFIKISFLNGFRISLSFDSKKEYLIVRNFIEKRYEVFLDTPETRKSFSTLLKFLTEGNSKKFLLNGITYLDSSFRITVLPAYNRPENIAILDAYQAKMDVNNNRIETISQFRILYKDRSLLKPIYISILSYREGILGAVLLKLDDKKLTDFQRKKILHDFNQDFKLPLGEFLSYDDLNEKEIYRHFLQADNVVSNRIELRSTKALKVYKELIKDKILSYDNKVDSTSRLCVNPSCQNYYRKVWENRAQCVACGDILILGKTVQMNSIDEENILKYIKKVVGPKNISIQKKKLLSRNLIVAQVKKDGITADFVALSKPIKDNQLEILKYRNPNVILITAKDNNTFLRDKGFEVVDFWEIVYKSHSGDSKIIEDCVENANSNLITRKKNLSIKSMVRILSRKEYNQYNLAVKNFGAEFFEADCSTLLDYVFGNCIWLGAKYRGRSLPDGFTAFPMLSSKNGCFIWDAKYSSGRKLVMGEYNKNKKYIAEAKKNKSIVMNGGLKGFVFISNNSFPKTFLKKYLPLTNGSNVKVNFLTSSQLYKIVRHYQKFEQIIVNNNRARLKFIDSMNGLFFKIGKGAKCEIISDQQVDSLCTGNSKYFKRQEGGKSLIV